MSKDNIKTLVNRFLTWPLPATVAADGCATNPNYAFPRSGTNLLTAKEAEAMLVYVLGLEDEFSLDVQSTTYAPTPAAQWREKGEADPHGNQYDCERAALTLGTMTDDELANEAFLNYDRRPSIQDLLDGKGFMPIVWMTAVKERIRWLSRALVRAQADAARYNFIRDDENWQQSDRYWEAISAGGEKLDKTVDDGIKSNAECEDADEF